MTIAYRLFFTLLLLPSFFSLTAQIQHGTATDSIAQAKVIELLEQEYILPYYEENINTAGDFILSSHVATIIKQKPSAGFDNYWVQVTDHRRYDNDACLNFYVDPKTWKVLYFDTKTNQSWTWEKWKKQAKYSTL